VEHLTIIRDARRGDDRPRMRGASCGCWRRQEQKVDLIPWNPGTSYGIVSRNGLKSSVEFSWIAACQPLCGIPADGIDGGLRAVGAATGSKLRPDHSSIFL